MGNTMYKLAEMYDDYCELCRLLKVDSLSLHGDFRIHEKALLEQNNYASTADALVALTSKAS